MARLESKQIMGYLPIDEEHHAAIISLVAPTTPAYKVLDPFAGEGDFLEAAAKHWHITPYANELDGERANKCIARFGAKQAVRSDALRLRASNAAFSCLWVNPPYDHDKAASGSKRVEFAMLRHSWKWALDGALVLWAIYVQHLTEEAMTFLAKNSRRVDVWALSGKHLGEYDQIIVAAIKGRQPDPDGLYEDMRQQKAHPLPLSVQDEPVYTLPAPTAGRRFTFAPDLIDAERGLLLVEAAGAWQSQAFQSLLDVPAPPRQIEPVVAPRPGHMALVLAAGVANGAIIDTDDYGQVAIRGKTHHVEEIARVDVESDPNDPERQVKKTTLRLKPTTTLTLLAGDGTLVEMDGDEALLEFITRNRKALAAYLNERFSPKYTFDFAGIGRWLNTIRLKGKYELYTAQKHVIGAVVRGFESRDGILLVGSMGSGKTAMGGTTAIAVTSGVVEKLRQQMRNDQVVLIVAPPHLLEKWKRELHSISANILVERLDRHEDVKRFMAKAEKLGAGIAKIGLIKRDLTKLGAGREVAVVWRDQPIALWRHNQPVPDGYEDQPRIIKQRVPTCPHCGCTVMQEKKGTTVPASEHWLKSGKRNCSNCQTPLWQDARDRGSKPKTGEKYPRKNPRYRIDAYIQRQYADRVFLLIWDEVHECQSTSTGNGEAFGRLAGVADKVLGMTGTPFNGRSSSLFNLEYHLNPRIRQRYPWGGADRLSRKPRGTGRFQTIVSQERLRKGRSESRWVEAMGVRERVLEERPSYDKETGAYTGTSTYEKPYEEAPGISPLLVAEVLDHTIFFGLGDLGKWLPRYEEIALPVEMDADTYVEYERTRTLLKDYLIGRRWQSDTTFRGAYLQWAMGWPTSCFRPTEVIHNLKHPITGEKMPHVVAQIPSYGESRIYAKEQALLDLLTDELAHDRPCVVYLRQTGTRDIQPRIEKLIRDHVPQAQPFVLKNTVAAERREQVIEQAVAAGHNIIVCNPELVRTGLDLVFAPTLVFYELTFNLSTLMQAAARSYRLNQTHAHCKVAYLYYEGTMEETAVHLMSRKQRAAKLLTGEIGLTGLEALTQGEAGFEQLLLDAIGKEETLLDASDLFKASTEQSAIDADDAAFWNVELDDEALPDVITLTPEPVVEPPPQTDDEPHDTSALVRYVSSYLDTVHLIHDRDKRFKLQAQLLVDLLEGVQKDDGTFKVVGMRDPEFTKYPIHAETMTQHVRGWLKKHRFVFSGCEEEAAAKIVDLAQQGLGLIPLKLDVFETLRDMRDEALQSDLTEVVKAVHESQDTPPKPKRKRKQKVIDLLAMPDDEPQETKRRPLVSTPQEVNDAPQQLALF